MTTRPIPIPLSTAPGEYAGEGAGRLINCYAEPLLKGSASPQVIKRVAGLDVLATAAQTVCRGLLEVNGVVYAVIGAQLVIIDGIGDVTPVGAVAGTKPVTMARNNKKPTPDKVLVTENGAYVFTDTTITAYPDPDLPVPNSVAMQDGYFLFSIGDGRVFATALNDTAVNALTFATAESKPDGLYRVIPYDNQALFFGPNSCEFWVDQGNTPPGFPYSRSTAKSYGLIAPTAIAGWENGFGGSDGSGGSSLLWVSDAGRVVKLQGYEAVDVSTPDIDRLIAATADKTTLEASVHVAGGGRWWVLSGPTFTVQFNLNTQQWNERASQLQANWNGSQSVYAFGSWLVGDRRSGNVYTVNPHSRKEGAKPLRMRLETGEVTDYPEKIRVARVDFDMSTGTADAAGGDPSLTDPVAEISFSDDGGSAWSPPQQVPLGKQGEYFKQITATRQGTSGQRGRRWRVDVSDPVYVGIIRGSQSSTMRRT